MKRNLYSILILLYTSITYLQAQDYLISFTGSGASTVVSTVKVENLTQGTLLTISGSDVLHLKGAITGIENVGDNEKGKITFYPNPMKGYTRMQFVLSEVSETIITLYDLSGRKMIQTQNLLSPGQHTYNIQGVEQGLYIVKISSGSYSYNGKLICSGSQNKSAILEYENTISTPEKRSDPKGIHGEQVMQYTTGDRLKMTGISGIFSTVITDIPVSSKTITYNFIDCTDGNNNNYPAVGIGTQVWMAENLKTTVYSNGVSIGTTSPYNKDISGENAPAYQWAYDGSESSTPANAWYRFLEYNSVAVFREYYYKNSGLSVRCLKD